MVFLKIFQQVPRIVCSVSACLTVFVCNTTFARRRCPILPKRGIFWYYMV